MAKRKVHSDSYPDDQIFPNDVLKLCCRFVSLGNNSASEYKAREQKSIHIDVTGEYLKIIFEKNYINSLNLYNQVRLQFSSSLNSLMLKLQVGLMALRLTGEFDPALLITNGANTRNESLIGVDPLVSNHAPPAAEFFAGNYVDQELQNIIEATGVTKKQAVKGKLFFLEATFKNHRGTDENFELARRLKTLDIITKKAAEEVSKLLLLKAKSIEVEDYDFAEDAKADIRQIKKALEMKMTELHLKTSSEGRIVRIESVIPLPTNFSKKIITTSDTTVDLSKSALEKFNRDSVRLEEMSKQISQFAVTNSLAQNQRPLSPIMITENSLPTIIADTLKLDSNSTSKTSAKTVLNSSAVKLPKISSINSSVFDNNEIKNSLAGLEEPEKLSDEQISQYGLLIQVYGLFSTSCVLSNRFNLREMAIEDIIKRVEAWSTKHRSKTQPKKEREVAPILSLLNVESKSKLDERGNNKVDLNNILDSKSVLIPTIEHIRIDWHTEVEAPEVDKESFISATFMAARCALEDAREKPLMSVLRLLELLRKIFGSSREVSKVLVFSHLEEIVPLLLLKSGQLSPRIKQGCLDMIVGLAKTYHIKSLKSNAPPRQILARLEALYNVTVKIGIDDMKELDHAGSGLTIKAVMAFVVPQLQNKNTAIREAAVNVVVAVCTLANNDELIFSYLTTIRPQLLQIIESKLAVSRNGLESQNSESRTNHTREINSPQGNTKTQTTPSNIQVEADLVQSLKQEIESLKTFVHEQSQTIKSGIKKSAKQKGQNKSTASSRPETRTKNSKPQTATVKLALNLRSNDRNVTEKKSLPEVKSPNTSFKTISTRLKSPNTEKLSMTIVEERLADTWNR
ncbi:hypothetical protein HK100_006459 [Physocladia obscura]|uniref:Centrosomal protein CEP104 N-terminal domain-containing protein n=1 Tax=Physocladia obscura TaxID=109957 RepID=A0AAD5TAV4_9FUNG|nr:hypothetical protein HK100_006459 [Physocladia obscura]